ncbi:MAG: sulfonate ABC transporter permease [Rhodovulum sulfidophilum]|uniref:Sulfonate ABC transporter permease n=1 Tax=Rhodovulum sulfidophilum TaxID=35806 RepID=A0A2W5Q026_RHOSU|nr:MAG: sulfonate ABC transporter permease [Rhodovulum sulfidophilum]
MPSAPPAPSDAYLAWQRARRRRRAGIFLARFAILAVFFAGWEIAPRMEWVNPMLTSYPSAVWQALRDMARDGQLWTNVGVTLREVVISFAVAMIAGTAIAIALFVSPTLERILDPFLVVLNALPKIALVPIFYIWLGPTGSIYAVAIAVSIFITILMLYTGFRQTDPDKVKLARTMGASRSQILGKVVLPGNLDTFVATLKANVGLSLVGVIVGEFQASTAGLGYLIVYGSQIFRMDMVMASIVLLGVMSIVIYLLIQWAERRLAR